MQFRLKSTAAALGLSLAMMTMGAAGALAQGPPPPQGYQQGAPSPGYPPGYQPGPPQPWETPPGEFQQIARQGFHDGIEGARKDFLNHRPPNVLNRDEYRHPNVPRELRRDYRRGFARGYQVGVQNIYNGGPR